MKFAYLLSAFAFLLAIAGKAAAFAINVDGNPAEWFTNTPTWTTVSGVNASIEDDQCTSSNPCPGGYLGPGWGDQLYDAEFLAATWDASTLSILVITGLPHIGTTWAPGDIAIDFGQDGIFEYGIETTGNNGNTVGAVYDVSSWGTDIWTGTSDPTSILGGSEVSGSSSDLAYTGNGTLLSSFIGYGSDAGDEHYAIETTVSLDHFGSHWGQDFTLHWTMNCGNNAIDLPVSVPEPSTLALLGIGFLGIGAARKLKKH